MKIINEKGKLFGLINIIDLLILLTVIAVFAGVLWKLMSPTIQSSISPMIEMTVVARVRGASDFLVKELERNPQSGKKMVSGNSYIDAYIESVAFEQYVVQTTTDDGRIVDAYDPTKKDVIVVMKSQVPKDTPTPKIGTQEIRAGRTMIVKTNDFETSANIDSVIFK